MARATGWAVLAILGFSLAACSVGSNKSADEKVMSDVPRAAPNTPHDPTPPAVPPAAATAPAEATAAPLTAGHPPMGGDPANEGGGGGGLGGVSVRFGIMPDYGADQPGVTASDVYAGTPADLGGMKPGDRMTKWNGQDIPDVESWMPFLSAAKPGDVVTITLVRDGQEITTKVTLTARD